MVVGVCLNNRRSDEDYWCMIALGVMYLSRVLSDCDETRVWTVGVRPSLCMCSDYKTPKMSVSYVHLTMSVIILGSAWHGPSGERGVGLMDQERGGLLARA